jgi:hypothetical protein
MKTTNLHNRVIRARKLIFSLPVYILFLFLGSFNKANAGVIISQVYASDGSSGSTYNASFIQLFNLSAVPVNINGWSVQWRGTAGNYTLIALPNVTIPAFQAFLIGGQAFSYGAALPAPFFSSPTLALPYTGGKVVLLNNTTLIPGNTCPASYIDLFGYGSANCYAGTPYAALIKTKSAIRSNMVNVSNLLDYTAINPWPFSFSFSGGSTLAVSLYNFSAHSKQGFNLIDWTASITGPSSFTLERSQNGIDFSSITVISASTIGTKNFSYSDNNLITAKEYYRLKMKDEAGVVTYSSIVQVSNESRSKSFAVLFPTIVSSQVSLLINSSSSEKINYDIVSVEGRIIKRGTVSVSNSQIEVSALARGQYFVHVKNSAGETEVLRFVKK